MGITGIVLNILMLVGIVGLIIWVCFDLYDLMNVTDDYGLSQYKYNRNSDYRYFSYKDTYSEWLTTKGGWAASISNFTCLCLIVPAIFGLMLSNGLRREAQGKTPPNYAQVAYAPVGFMQQPQQTFIQQPQPQQQPQTTVVVTQ